MFIALSEFCLRCLFCTDSTGSLKLPPGSKKTLTRSELNLIENLYNWRTGKNKPRNGTLDAMKIGDFGDAGKITISLVEAMESKDFVKIAAILDDDLYRVYGVFNIVLDGIREIDGKISKYLTSVNTEMLNSTNLPAELKECVKSFKSSRIFNVETVCLFYLYFWVYIESHNSSSPHKPFQMIFEHDGKTLYDSFIKIIREGIHKRNHKMSHICDQLHHSMDEKEFNKRLRTPSRFCSSDFLKDFAEAYYNVCFANENNKPKDASALFAIWNTVVHAACCMDKAKKMWNVDFRVLAKKYYATFSTANYFPIKMGLLPHSPYSTIVAVPKVVSATKCCALSGQN